MNRTYQVLLVVSTLGFSWLGMQVVHEAGHVVFARMSGETVHRVVLHPLTISRTDATHDRHPLLVVWGGPLVGSMLPLVALGIARIWRVSWFYLVQFFTGFCLVANGVYLGIGWAWGVGDAGDLLGYGAPRWTLVAFGLVAAPLGLFLWNGLGPYFGLGEARGRVSRRVTYGTLAVLLLVILIELLVGRRD